MLIINEQFREGERAQQWKTLAGLPPNDGQFRANTRGPKLLITSRSGVLRPFSDNSKDELCDIIIHAHMQNTLIYSNMSEKNRQE